MYRFSVADMFLCPLYCKKVYQFSKIGEAEWCSVYNLHRFQSFLTLLSCRNDSGHKQFISDDLLPNGSVTLRARTLRTKTLRGKHITDKDITSK